MPTAPDRLNAPRLWSAAAVLLVHLLLAWALLAGLRVDLGQSAADSLALFAVAEPSPRVSEPSPQPAPGPEGAASPPDLHADPAPLAAPVPVIDLAPPPPLVVAPVAAEGFSPGAGAADVPGPGTGAGGPGSGIGSGGSGTGTGGGGATRARLLRGAILDRDYPREARRAGKGGIVYVRFTVDPDGRATDCRVVRSSGTPSLDAATCRLIEQRFRYDPARDPAGRPVAETRLWKQDWWLERRRSG